MKKLILMGCLIFSLGACEKNNPNPNFQLKEKSISMGTYQLTAYYTDNQKDIVVVFEAGLGDGAEVWQEKNILSEIAQKAEVIIYDRAGYGKSQKGTEPRDIPALSDDLTKVITQLAGNKQVILMGHSLGGMIIRDYAIKNPTKVKALLFIDPSHEDYNGTLTQSQEDEIYELFKSLYGSDFGGTMESRYVIEDATYTPTLAALPNIPAIVLTSMKITTENNQADRQKWYDAHEKLKLGLSDFTHLSTTKSGHYIQREESDWVIQQLNILLEKIKK